MTNSTYYTHVTLDTKFELKHTTNKTLGGTPGCAIFGGFLKKKAFSGVI